MSYVDVGYAVALVVLFLYALGLVRREQAARRRLGGWHRARNSER